jgi:hypothetical protein
MQRNTQDYLGKPNWLDWVFNMVETTRWVTQTERGQAVAANLLSTHVVAMKTQSRAEREKREADGTVPRAATAMRNQSL